MSRQSEARRRKRAMKAAGVELVHRSHLIGKVDVDMLTAAIRSDLLALEAQGADLTGRLKIDIGNHPSFPGRTTIEAKAGSRVPETPKLAIIDELPEDHDMGDCSDPRCPLDHSLDRLDG